MRREHNNRNPNKALLGSVFASINLGALYTINYSLGGHILLVKFLKR